MPIDYNKIFEVSDSYQAPSKLMEILFDKEKREVLFMKLLRVNNMNVDFDWFHEYFQNEHADRKKKKQDFTPECVCDLVSKLVMNSKGDNGNYYEICAGTGGMMIKHWDNFRKSFSSFDYEPKYHFAFVEELSDRTVPFLLLNMMIRGMNGIVIHGNSLTRECKNAYFICNTKNDPLQFSEISVVPHDDLFGKELMLFDRVIANPPYSLKDWGREKVSVDKFGRFRFGLPPASVGDYAFVQHMLATLSHTGKAGIVLPHGVLFRGKAEGKIRQGLVKEDLIEAIIGLPANLFYGTDIPATIILYNKDKEEARQNKIFFIDASRDFQEGKNQNVLRDEDVEKIVSTFDNYEEIEKYSRIVTLDEIKENEYNLNIPRYVDTYEEEEEIDIHAVMAEIKKLEDERAKLDKEIEAYLKELGL